MYGYTSVLAALRLHAQSLAANARSEAERNRLARPLRGRGVCSYLSSAVASQ